MQYASYVSQEPFHDLDIPNLVETFGGKYFPCHWSWTLKADWKRKNCVCYDIEQYSHLDYSQSTAMMAKGREELQKNHFSETQASRQEHFGRKGSLWAYSLAATLVATYYFQPQLDLLSGSFESGLQTIQTDVFLAQRRPEMRQRCQMQL